MDSLSTTTRLATPSTDDLPPAVAAAVAEGRISEDGLRLVGAFAVFGPAFRRLVETHAAMEGVSVSRMRLLHQLQVGGAQIMRQLRRHLGVTARSVTQLVDGLEDDDLVRRVPHPTDRRATVIELTAAGRELVEQGWSRHVIAMAEFFDHLAPEDRSVLLRLVDELRAHMEDMGIDAACRPQS